MTAGDIAGLPDNASLTGICLGGTISGAGILGEGLDAGTFLSNGWGARWEWFPEAIVTAINAAGG